MSLLIAFAIPSLTCFLVIFYYFIQLRKKLLFDRINHHVILCILISDFLLITTELPFSLSYLSFGYMQSTKICLFWTFWDYYLQAATLFLTMYAAIERYLLVFHRQCIMKNKLFFHYIPLGFVCCYSFGIYLYFIPLFSCKPNYSYDLAAFVCGGPCYLNAFVQNIYDTIIDIMLPTCVLLVFNLLMIGRVIRYKHKVSPSTRVSNILKKSRRMILQLLAISLMTLLNWMPWIFIILVHDFYDPSFGEQFITIFLHYLPYFTSFASPFLALINLPEIREEFKKVMRQLMTTLHILNSTQLDLESSSMELIFLSGNYPNLYGLGLFDIQQETVLRLFTDEILLTNTIKNQMVSVAIGINTNEIRSSINNGNPLIFTHIFTIFNNLRYLSFGPSCLWYQRLSFNEFLTVASSTLLELHVCLSYFDDCLYLLDGRFNQLHTFCVDLKYILSSGLTISKELKKNIISHIPQLERFTFNIRSLIHYHNQIDLTSNKDIQYTLMDFKDDHIISCVDYSSVSEEGHCHIYSYPYRSKYYNNITNNFPGGLFQCVSKVSFFDERPFEHEFFLRIARSFPLLKKLTLINKKPQNNKGYRTSKNDNQALSIVNYRHLIQLHLTKAH
ncbi:unnamed protein product [Rotaria socialis]|uniref:G-protein coupled receptors family 1 profile domain-containing protein n=2 Tax=Rotaria socialis TaxID=392032 RepID=A0A818ZM79_9BILA|nr:unnamed protein product [Rotaria socialis]